MPTLQKGEKWRDAIDPKRKKRPFQYPLIAEDKIDGIRLEVLAKTQALEILSFAGKPLYNLDDALEPLFAMMMRENLSRLDCEVQINDCFADTYRWCRSKKGIPVDLKGGKIRVYILDLPDHADKSYEVRSDMIRMIVDKLAAEFTRLGQVLVHSDADVQRLYEDARARFKEGLMLKNPLGSYSGKRTWDWLKLKPEEPHDGKITQIIRAVAEDGTPHDRAGSVVVVLEDGSTASPSGIAHALASEMYEHPERFVGEWVEFTCMERDRQGGYRHPIFKRLREAKQ